MNIKKRPLIIIIIILILVIISVTNIKKFKFLVEIIKLSDSLPTISNDFYNEPIENITYKDLVFKKRDNKELTLDIYTNKEANEATPVIIYVFGNGWMYGDKVIPSAIESIIDLLKDEGYAVISTSYELMDDEVILEEQISDVKDTIRWVYKNKDKYNFDVNNIGIIGPSAGAQLSMMAAFSQDDEFIGDQSLKSYSSKVKYIIDLFGPARLSKVNLSVGPEEVVEKFSDNDIEKLSKEFSPIEYVREDLPNTLIIHSLKDNIVPYETSVELYETALKYNNKFELYTLQNCTHYLENLSNTEALNLYMKIVDYILSETS
ncbi:alpha/beta hydrolase [Clostridium sp.]|uniref:alpha/beta hydrolase n=1 Tax=Clostridium sp. TaxID=1506 RepID=UPI0025B895FF|nr:alpha/beta hydrolase [Clostridium sp.]MBS4955545.1 alpha/beta hydrolase [Clostridium sp.]MDU4882265.1 alpha/beta hydrolase [Clostridium celatum]MDU7075535.1 alpha/beta hydrolase [Clostridium celatum]